MARAVVDLIADDHRGLPRKRMEWIGDLNLASQMSGIHGVASERGGERAVAIYTLVATAIDRISLRKARSRSLWRSNAHPA